MIHVLAKLFDLGLNHWPQRNFAKIVSHGTSQIFKMSIWILGKTNNKLKYSILELILACDYGDNSFNPIQSVLWNYVKECGGAIMARIDLGILKL